MNTTLIIHYPLIRKWVKDNLNSNEAKSELDGMGLDGGEQEMLLAEFKKLRNEKRFFQGLAFIIIGALTGLISCVLTITNPVPHLYNLILFGLTSLAIIIAFIGLYLIFE